MRTLIKNGTVATASDLYKADLVIDGGELAGTPSTVIDLRGYEEGSGWSIARAGAVAEEEIAAVLG